MLRVLYFVAPLALSCVTPALACNRIVNLGSTVSLNVPEKTGLTIVLPKPVSSMVPPKQFSIQPVGAPNPKTGQVENPRSFLIEPLAEGASDEFTLFLGSAKDKSAFLTFSVSTSKEGKSVQEFCLPDTARYKVSQDFLSLETNIMLAMIRDDLTFGRKVIDESIKFDGFGDVRVRAVRVFRSDGYTGYTFLLTNTSSKTLKLNLPSLSFGKPNRAVMIHVDHDVLETCQANNSKNPKDKGCTTALRVLVDGDLKPKYLGNSESFPFIYAQEKKEGMQ